MTTQIEHAAKSLFPETDAAERVTNVKFFMGWQRNVPAEKFAEQLNRADAQVRNGTALESSLDDDLTAVPV